MTDRRPLVAGVKAATDPERVREQQFVYATKPAEPLPPKPAPLGRLPFTTRIRRDFALALKRASLERQLQGVELYTVQEIFEQALEPWLRANGYLP